LNPKNTLREELYATFTEERKLTDDITKCEQDIADSVDNEAKMNEYLDKLQGLQEKAISKGVYSLNSKIEKMMDNMGFSKSDADSLVSTFSGGWKMRIGLAKILLENPNIVLLDEVSLMY
jgi:ATPase subunit of ABC transporter with duplicated ATPase domains